MSLLSSVRWLSLAAAFLAGGAVGGAFIDALRTAQIADLTATHATAQTVVAQANLRRWQAASARADAVEKVLAQRTAELTTLTQAKENDLRYVTTGRPCLSDPAVRLLNRDTAPGLRVELSNAAGSPDAAATAFATDTDVGQWIIGAQDAYAHCRDTRRALIDWWEDDPHD